jgi:hypothetical protein
LGWVEQGCILLKCLNIVFFEFFYDQHPPPSKKKEKRNTKRVKIKAKEKEAK